MEAGNRRTDLRGKAGRGSSENLCIYSHSLWAQAVVWGRSGLGWGGGGGNVGDICNTFDNKTRFLKMLLSAEGPSPRCLWVPHGLPVDGVVFPWAMTALSPEKGLAKVPWSKSGPQGLGCITELPPRRRGNGDPEKAPPSRPEKLMQGPLPPRSWELVPSRCPIREPRLGRGVLDSPSERAQRTAQSDSCLTGESGNKSSLKWAETRKISLSS
uniref:Uncharacterized protein n=1 Tax=Molossus molossus TaxID=27622 RepID=A0A7J8HC61_MOLMO|nr:hypothetical protein HJG59_011216 [Molossus molossus]